MAAFMAQMQAQQAAFQRQQEALLSSLAGLHPHPQALPEEAAESGGSAGGRGARGGAAAAASSYIRDKERKDVLAHFGIPYSGGPAVSLEHVSALYGRVRHYYGGGGVTTAGMEMATELA
eukprot:53059-Eustigmatos_ZCMA.PRE.1